MQEAHGLLSESTKPKQGFRREIKRGLGVGVGGRFQKRFHGEGDTGSAVWRAVRISTGGGEKPGEEGAPPRTNQDLAERCNCRRAQNIGVDVRAFEDQV